MAILGEGFVYLTVKINSTEVNILLRPGFLIILIFLCTSYQGLQAIPVLLSAFQTLLETNAILALI